MTAKLTLSISENAVCKGKKYANDTGRSLSGIVEEYLNRLDSSSEKGISPAVSALSGIGKGKFDEESYRNHLERKNAR